MAKMFQVTEPPLYALLGSIWPHCCHIPCHRVGAWIAQHGWPPGLHPDKRPCWGWKLRESFHPGEAIWSADKQTNRFSSATTSKTPLRTTKLQYEKNIERDTSKSDTICYQENMNSHRNFLTQKKFNDWQFNSSCNHSPMFLLLAQWNDIVSVDWVFLRSQCCIAVLQNCFCVIVHQFRNYLCCGLSTRKSFNPVILPKI